MSLPWNCPVTARTLQGDGRFRSGQAPAWFRSGRPPGRLGLGPRTVTCGRARPDPARIPPFVLMERRVMRSSTVPDPGGSGDHPDQRPGDPVRRLRVPGAGAAPWQDRAASPIAPARARHWPGPGRPGVRREYDHQPGAPAASCVAPCAFAAVRDITGRLLLVRRCDTGDWELPGGHVDPGESAADTAGRGAPREARITREGSRLTRGFTRP